MNEIQIAKLWNRGAIDGFKGKDGPNEGSRYYLDGWDYGTTARILKVKNRPTYQEIVIDKKIITYEI